MTCISVGEEDGEVHVCISLVVLFVIFLLAMTSILMDLWIFFANRRWNGCFINIYRQIQLFNVWHCLLELRVTRLMSTLWQSMISMLGERHENEDLLEQMYFTGSMFLSLET